MRDRLRTAGMVEFSSASGSGDMHDIGLSAQWEGTVRNMYLAFSLYQVILHDPFDMFIQNS